MFVADLVVVAVFMLFIESKILGSRFILLSPFTLAQFALLYMYILPFLFQDSSQFINYVSRLDLTTARTFLLSFRIFYYSFCCTSIVLFYNVREKIRENRPLRYKLSNTSMLLSIFFLTLVIVFAELRITGFNVGLLIDKMINPRKYTYFREGYGVLNHAVGFSKAMLVFLAVIFERQRRKPLSKVILLVGIAVSFLGGSKSSLLSAMIVMIIVYQKISNKNMNKRLLNLAVVAVLLFSVAIISFAIMRTERSEATILDTLERVVAYSQEGYYSARVISDFSWDIEYVGTVLESIVLSGIPRQMFPEKSFYGLYNKHWRPYYQPNTAQYHTSTYGFLAEAHMLFSYFGPFLYALFFGWLFRAMYIGFYRCRKLSSLFFLTYVFAFLYFFIRTGLFMGTNLWVMLIMFLGSKFYFLILNFFNGRRKGSATKTFSMLKV